MHQTPLVNHWWNVTLYVTSRGLTTGIMPYGERAFDIEMDFTGHKLVLRSSDGGLRALPLRPQTVASFYAELMQTLDAMHLPVKIDTMPAEVPDPIPFDQDHQHASYDAEYAQRFWRILLQVDRVFKQFRGRFTGKASPVHFFWGSFDLAVSRFNGQRAPERPGADHMTREAYSHATISAGFWPGSGAIQTPAFYSYTVPEPQQLGKQEIRPDKAFYSSEMNEFILYYDDVRKSADPAAALMDFLQSTYEAGANLAGWDRASLERTA